MLRAQRLAGALLCLSACLHFACGSAHMRALRQYAGNYKYNSLAGVEDEKETGAIYGTGEKANVCLFPRGSVNPWNLHVVQDVMQVTAEALVAVGGRGSFIAPKKGALVYGPSCLLYDYVCNFNYQEPCNRQGICQTNNTCFCGNGFASCAPSTGLQPLPNTLYGTYASSAGCETDLYTDIYNCGHCGNVCPTTLPFCSGGVCSAALAPPPPPLAAPPPPPAAGRRMLETPIEPWGNGKGAKEDSASFADEDSAGDGEDESGDGAWAPGTAGRRLQEMRTGRWHTREEASESDFD